MLKKIRNNNLLRLLEVVHQKDKSIIILSIISTLFTTSIPFLFIVFFSRLIDNIVLGEDNIFLLPTIYISILAIVSVINFALKNAITYKRSIINNNVRNDVNFLLLDYGYEKISNPETFQNIRKAEMSLNYTGGFDSFIAKINNLLSSFLSVIVGIILVIVQKYSFEGLLFLGNEVALIILSMFIIILLVLIQNLSRKKIKSINNTSISHFKRILEHEKKLGYYIYKVINDYSKGATIRMFGLTKLLINDYTKSNDLSREDNIIQMRYRYKVQLIVLLLSSLTYFSFSAIAATLVFLGVISIGTMTLIISTTILINNSINNVYVYFRELIKQADNLQIYMTTLSDINNRSKFDNSKSTKVDENHTSTLVEFRNVNFKYQNSSTYIFKDFNLSIDLSKKTALVGRNGAGKTTLIKLLCGLLTPESGDILIFGKNIIGYKKSVLFDDFAFVMQDYSLFAFPIGQNISTSIDYDDDRVLEILAKLNMLKRVQEMPDGLNTNLFGFDDNSSNISVGEGQKIAIARAIYKNAKYIVLDEPTSNLEPKIEMDIYSDLDKYFNVNNILYISHRLSSCRFCDNIIVLDNGVVVEMGNHDELINNNKLYSKLWEIQSAPFED